MVVVGAQVQERVQRSWAASPRTLHHETVLGERLPAPCSTGSPHLMPAEVASASQMLAGCSAQAAGCVAARSTCGRTEGQPQLGDRLLGWVAGVPVQRTAQAPLNQVCSLGLAGGLRFLKHSPPVVPPHSPCSGWSARRTGHGGRPRPPAAGCSAQGALRIGRGHWQGAGRWAGRWAGGWAGSCRISKACKACMLGVAGRQVACMCGL